MWKYKWLFKWDKKHRQKCAARLWHFPSLFCCWLLFCRAVKAMAIAPIISWIDRYKQHVKHFFSFLSFFRRRRRCLVLHFAVNIPSWYCCRCLCRCRWCCQCCCRLCDTTQKIATCLRDTARLFIEHYGEYICCFWHCFSCYFSSIMVTLITTHQ